MFLKSINTWSASAELQRKNALSEPQRELESGRDNTTMLVGWAILSSQQMLTSRARAFSSSWIVNTGPTDMLI
jgi:hypothetical protein